MKRLIAAILVTALLSGFGNPASAALVAWYKLDESGATTVAADSSGNVHDATLTNFADPSVSWVTGQVNGALEFDGIDDWVDPSTGPSLDGSAAPSLLPAEAELAAV